MIRNPERESDGDRRRAHQCGGRLRWALLTVVLVPFLITSCSVIKPPPTPEIPVDVPERFSIDGETVSAERWWESFEDSELNDLIERALDGNFDLRVAWDRLDQAAALARRAGAQLWPTVDAEVTGSRSHQEGTATSVQGGAFSGSDAAEADRSTTRNRFSLGLGAAYEVDLWGREHSGRRAAELDVHASREDLSAAAMTLSAEVTSTWYRLVEQRAILKVLEEQIRTNEDLLNAVEFRAGHSRASVVDIFQQRRQLESTRGEVPLSTMRTQLLEHQLAVLLGGMPQEKVPGESIALPENLPPLPRTGLPAALVRRRPDLLAAHARLAAANQRVAAAVADRYPAIRLSGGAETSDQNVSDLFDDWLASIAGNLVGPLFDGGRRSAEVARTRAVAAERLNQYAKVVLQSLQEVEDALVREQRQREYLESLDRQIELSRRLVTESRLRYVNGDTDYLPVLEAIATLQRLERSRIESGRILIEYRIALHRSLGGGWELERPQKIEPKQEPNSGDTE